MLINNSVATTALLVTHWKNEARKKDNWPAIAIQPGARDKDLFKDDYYAKYINGAVVAEASARLDKRLWLATATRTKFFRKAISQAVKEGVSQVVLLGGGLDTLAARKPYAGVHYYKIDVPEVLAVERQVMGDVGNQVSIPLDYVKEDLLKALRATDIDFEKPTCVLWEGNVFYLEPQDFDGVLRQISAIFPRLILAFDFMHETMHAQTTQLDQQGGAAALAETLKSFEVKKSPFKFFCMPAQMDEKCKAVGLKQQVMKTAAELAIAYQVDENPYYTAKPYSVAVYRR